MSYCSARMRTFAATVAAGIFAAVAVAQPTVPPAGGRGGRGGRGPVVVSPEVKPDGRVVFRIAAPKAEKVTLNSGDISILFSGGGAGAITGTNITTQMPAEPLPASGPEFTKNSEGIWEATVGPVPPGAYRYVFEVDGVRTLDPVNTRTAESRDNLWSLFPVPGAEMMDTNQVPHGAVAEIYMIRRCSRPPGACTSTPRPDMKRATRSTRSSTCCTARATPMTRGPRSAAPISSSTMPWAGLRGPEAWEAWDARPRPLARRTAGRTEPPHLWTPRTRGSTALTSPS